MLESYGVAGPTDPQRQEGVGGVGVVVVQAADLHVEKCSFFSTLHLMLKLTVTQLVTT